jgi:hypothetical protein
MANFNADVSVTVTAYSGGVNITNFGRICFATDDVEAGFTEDYKIYESNNEAQNDSDLSATAKLALAAFFSQSPRPKDIMVAPVTYASIGTDLDALLLVVGGTSNDFYCVVTEDQTAANLETLSDWATANDKICFIQSLDAAITAGTVGNLFETLLGDLAPRTAGVWHDDALDYVALGWAARVLSADMDSTSSVSYDKEVTGVNAPPSTAIDTTKKAQVLAYNGNLYLPFFGDPVMRPGTMFDGDAIEDKILEDWTKARVQEALARLAKRQSNNNSKVPYDDFGIAMVESEIRGVIDKGIQIGHFVADSLTLDVPALADISAAVRATKTLTITGSVQKTGSIEYINFTFGITF